MRFTIGSCLAIVTIIGSILIGGSTFGDLRATTETNTKTLMENRLELREMATGYEKDYRYTHEILSTIASELSVLNEVLRRLEKKLDR